MAQSKKIIDVEKPTVTHEAPENPTALLGSAGFLRLLRSRRCGWITIGTIGKRSLREEKGREDEARPIPSCSTMGSPAELKRPDKDLPIEIRTPTLCQIAADSPMQCAGGCRNRLTWTPLDTMLRGNN